jgi:hypothetical protein
VATQIRELFTAPICDFQSSFALPGVSVRGAAPTASPPVDAASPILLIGDSFAQEYSRDGRRAGLPEHLLRALGFRVDLIAMGRGAPWAARAATAMGRPGLVGKKLLIYELHALAAFHFNEWKLVDMGRPDAGAPP